MLSRSKFELGSLAAEMLVQLPKSIWTSKTTTFFDPAIGGGQFVNEIERRLTAAGHSKKNIASRVFGCEELPHRVKYAVSKHKLVGKYATADFLAQDFNGMKFDVIVGNPPFQNKSENSDGALWLKFVNKGMELIAENGRLIFISPTSWVGKQTNTKKQDWTPFTDNHVKIYKPLTAAEKKTYFGTVGSSFGYYLITKGTGSTKIVLDDGSCVTYQLVSGEPLPNKVNSISFSIHQKLAKVNKLQFQSNFKFHSQVLKAKGIMADLKSKQHPYTTYYSHNLIRYTTGKQDLYSEYKVMVPNVGTLANSWLDHNCNLTEDVKFLTVNNKKDGESLIAILTSSLYRYIGNHYRPGRNLGTVFNFLPALDLSKKWTDQDLYKHFKLTKKEIDYIESNVK